MTTETLMTEQAAPTTESQPASQAAPEQGAQQQQATQEQKPAATQEAKPDGNSESEQAKPEGAPEKYEFTAPEGREFDKTVLEKFSEVAKELNLSQENAQKVIDRLAPAMIEKQERARQEALNQWVEGAKADKEFGGDKLNENLVVAKQALEKFGTPELKTLLNESGLGNHPELIRLMYRAGKAISEDTFVASGSGAKIAKTGPSDYAKSLYPNQH